MLEAAKRPWYARALTCGIGIGIGLALSLLSGHGNHAEGAEPERLVRIEAKVDALIEKVAKLEGRLEKR